VCLSAGAILISACDKPPAINPWRNDSISRDTWPTPSSEGVLASGHAPVLRNSGRSQTAAPCVAAQVPHYPLWWEDPFEDKGDGDGQFAWTWADYLASPYCYARWLLNTVAWPASAVVTPPGTPMVSDGHVGRDHDAARGQSPNPTAGPEDFQPR
jgi:hypothetical protein